MSPAPPTLPDDMAAAIGRAVACFGFLEEALKRAIFALTRARLGEDAPEAALAEWVQRMEEIADDTMGTLIDAFVAQARRARAPGTDRLALDLRAVRLSRNLLCHASWRRGSAPEAWFPAFIHTRGGGPPPTEMTPADVDGVRAATLDAARRVIAIMRATGIAGEVAGLPDAGDGA